MGIWFDRAVTLTMLAAATMTASCASGTNGMASLPPVPVAVYRLAPGDEVRVLVPGLVASADVVNATYTVNERGQLSLPLLGDIDANNRTVTELQGSIASQLVQRQLLNTPTVSVQPVRLRPFYVLGEVKTPGEYQYRAGISVLAAVSVAGGYTFRAQQGTVEIMRMIDGHQVVGRARPMDMVQPGDTIRVHEKWF